MLFALTLLGVLALFGATILAHEMGHFLAARGLGLHVDVFSLGFGPALWRRERRGVAYQIGLFPAGGYVAIPQLEPGGGRRTDADGVARDLPPVPPWKKIFVALAGSAGNFLLALALATFLFVVGKPSAPHEISSVIGYVDPESMAYQAGVREGDRIRSVNGEPVRNWMEFRMLAALREEATLELDTAAGVRTVTLPTRTSFGGVREIEGVGPEELCRVLAVIPGSSAEAAGVRRGDLVREMNGQRVFSIPHLIRLVDQARDQTVPLRVERDGQLMELWVTPAFDASLGRAVIGIRFDVYSVVGDQRVHIPPFQQLRTHAAAVFRVLRALLTPREARHAARGLGGPVAILWSLWVVVRSNLLMALWFTAFLNVNLAVLNLLPVPFLDGGHILFAVWEIVTRRPLHERVAEALSYVFYALFVALLVFLSYRDVLHYLLAHPRSSEPPRQVAPEPAGPAGAEAGSAAAP